MEYKYFILSNFELYEVIHTKKENGKRFININSSLNYLIMREENFYKNYNDYNIPEGIVKAITNKKVEVDTYFNNKKESFDEMLSNIYKKPLEDRVIKTLYNSQKNKKRGEKVVCNAIKNHKEECIKHHQNGEFDYSIILKELKIRER